MLIINVAELLPRIVNTGLSQLLSVNSVQLIWYDLSRYESFWSFTRVATSSFLFSTTSFFNRLPVFLIQIALYFAPVLLL